MDLEKIREALADRNIDKVAERTGIHRNTIYAIRSGANVNPTYAILKKLSDYLEN